MQAVILAAGKSSRFYPFNQDHKSAIKILGKSLIQHTIESAISCGVKNFIIVVDGKSEIPKILEEANLKVSLQFIVQPEAKGMGNALLLAKEFIENEFFLVGGYHVEVADHIKLLLKKEGADAVLLAKERDQVDHLGVLKTDGDRVVEVIEKPKKGEEPSKLSIVATYLFSKKFLDILSKTDPQHYQLEIAISEFAKKANVVFVKTEDSTVSLKYPWDLIAVKNYLLRNIKRSISDSVSISSSAEIIGEVMVEDGVKIMEGVRIKGPAYIGKNVYVGNNALLRDRVDVEEDCKVGSFVELKNTLMMEGSTTHSGFIGDSIIGKKTKIAAGFTTGNVRLDREPVEAIIKDEKTNTGLKSLGVMMGNSVSVGIKSSSMPGVIVGNNVIIGPSTVLQKNIPDDTRYYTKFSEVVEKKIKK